MVHVTMKTTFPFFVMTNRHMNSLLILGMCLAPIWSVSASTFNTDFQQSAFLALMSPSPKTQLYECYAVNDKDKARMCIKQILHRETKSSTLDLRTRHFQTSSLLTNTRKDATSSMGRRATHCLALKDQTEREKCALNASGQKQSRRTTILNKDLPISLPKDQCDWLQGQERVTCRNSKRILPKHVSHPESARILKMKAQNIDR